MSHRGLAALLVAAAIGTPLHAEIVFSGSVITENFDSLATADHINVFPGTIGLQAAVPGTTGFEATRLAGSSSSSSHLVFSDDGTTTTGGVQDYGGAASTDRALGLLASDTRTMAMGFALRNNVPGAIITSITITFNQENWRTPSSATNTLTAAWATSDTPGVTATNYLTAGGMIAVPELNMSLAPTATAMGQNGNDPANKVVKSYTFTSLNLAFDDQLFLRWHDSNDTGDDAGIAIDDMMLSFVTAVPELSAFWLGAAVTAAAGLVAAWLRLRRIARQVRH